MRAMLGRCLEPVLLQMLARVGCAWACLSAGVLGLFVGWCSYSCCRVLKGVCVCMTKRYIVLFGRCWGWKLERVVLVTVDRRTSDNDGSRYRRVELCIAGGVEVTC